MEKDNISYGVEVKNGLGYPDDLYWKFIVAAELDTIPLIIARWLNPAQQPLIGELGGAYIVYKTALYSTTYKDIIEKVVNTLGAPIEPRDEIDQNFFIRKVNPIHCETKKSINSKKEKIRHFLLDMRTQYEIRKKLGDRTG